MEPMTSDRRLRFAAIVFAVAVLLHNGDHLRRGGGSVASDVFAVGAGAMVMEVAVVALVLMGHRWGPLAAASIGGGLTAGYVLVHLAPERSWLSDSLVTGEGVAWASWVAVVALIAASVLLAWAGWASLRARGGLVSAAAPARQLQSRVHPVTAVMVVGNLVVLAGSVATL
jgi:hypothetical protein